MNVLLSFITTLITIFSSSWNMVEFKKVPASDFFIMTTAYLLIFQLYDFLIKYINYKKEEAKNGLVKN